jgi:membrane protein required for colicin V production
MKLSDILNYLETLSGNIHFNFLDIVFIIIISGFSLYGLIRGFVKELVSIISILLGLCIALYWYEEAARYLTFLRDQNLQNILGFITVFIGMSLIFGLLGKLANLALMGIETGCMGHLLGFVFGFVKGVAVVCVILLVLVSFLPPSNKRLSGSQLSPAIISLTKTLAALAPTGLTERFAVKLDELKKVWSRGSPINTVPKADPGQPASTSTTTIIHHSGMR